VPASLGDPTSLRINEWLASPPGNDDDFFELYNPNAQPVSLGGLYLTDALGDRTMHRIANLSFISFRTGRIRAVRRLITIREAAPIT
jgi:hypothetical protein